jgi:REP element-mobilizing transposase RayT
MKLYKSNDPNTFHYVTLVTHDRVPVFRSDEACQIFVDVRAEVRERFPYKLIGYVLMPDHVHAIVNNAKAQSASGCTACGGIRPGRPWLGCVMKGM